MPPRSSRLLIILSAAALLVLAVGTTVARLHHAGVAGWAGLSYMPPSSEPRVPFVWNAGAVVLLNPGSPADHAGLSNGDEIATINGVPISDRVRLNALSARLRRGDLVTYEVRHGNAKRVVRLRLVSPLAVPDVIASLATSVVVSLVFMLTGAFVFLRRPGDRRANVFFLLTMVAAGYLVAMSTVQIDAANTRGITWGEANRGLLMTTPVLLLAATLFAPLLLHLALIFPRERPILAKRPKLLAWIYAYPIFVTALTLSLLVMAVFVEDSRKDLVRNTLYVMATVGGVLAVIAAVSLVRTWRRLASFRAALFDSPLAGSSLIVGCDVAMILAAAVAGRYFHTPMAAGFAAGLLATLPYLAIAIYPVATLIAMYRSYRESGVEEKRQVKWPLWGTIVAISGRILLQVAGFFIAISMLFGNSGAALRATMTPVEVLAKLFYVLIPISFAVGILKYRLMNIDVIIRRTVAYSILTAVVFVVYVVLVGGVGTALVTFAGVTNQATVVIATIFIAVIAVPLRNRLQRLVDRNLFRERRDYPAALRNLAAALGRDEGVDAFLRYAAEIVQQAVQNRFVIILQRRGTEYVAAAKVGVADDLLGHLRVDADDATYASLAPLAPAHVVPTREALLAAGAKLSDQELDADDIEFLRSAATQINLGIENVRLRTEEVEYEQARAMQLMLLPKTLPQLAGFKVAGSWHPARSVGGDYYDVLALGDGKLGICIADVAGKGMPAALLMANLQAAVKATASAETSPAEVCRKVKRVVSGNLAGGKFISFFYGVLDEVTSTLTYTNAGHNPPIVVRAKGATEELAEGGPAFARLFGDDYRTATVALHSGDRVVLFTDGASEARRADAELGEARLAAIAAEHRAAGAAALHAALADAVMAYTGGEIQDDITIVVVEKT